MDLDFCTLCQDVCQVEVDDLPIGTSTSSKARPQNCYTRVERTAARFGVTRTDLEAFLGQDYQYLLDSPPGTVTLFEVFAGEARTSDCEERCGGLAIRMGLRYGHNLNQSHQRACVRALAHLLEPDDIWVSWPCTYVGSWSRYNMSRGEATRKQILEGRRQTKAHLALFHDLFKLQSERSLGCHGENPEGSLAFEYPCIKDLQRNYSVYWAKFPQCAFGLKHPANSVPMLKVTEVMSTDSQLVEALNSKTCTCKPTPQGHRHERVAGTYHGRDISSWAEDYPPALAKAIVTGMLKSRQDRHYKASLIDECYAGTIRKRNIKDDPYNELLRELDLDKPQNKKKKSEDVPAQENPQTTPSSNSKASQSFPCTADPDATTLFNSIDQEFLEHGGCLERDGKLIHIYRNSNQVKILNSSGSWSQYTVYGKQQSEVWQQLTPTYPTVKSRDQTAFLPVFDHVAVVYDVIRLVTPSDPKALQTWLRRLHVGLAHASNAEMIQVLKSAGASRELLEATRTFQCHGCLAWKSPASHRVSSKHLIRNFNDQLF